MHRIVNRALETKLIRQKANIVEINTYSCLIKHMIKSLPASTIRTSSTDDFQTVNSFQLMTEHSVRRFLPPYRTRKDYKVDELQKSNDVARHFKFQDA